MLKLSFVSCVGTGGYVEGVKSTVEVSAIHINKEDYPREDKVKDSCRPLDFQSINPFNLLYYMQLFSLQ